MARTPPSHHPRTRAWRVRAGPHRRPPRDVTPRANRRRPETRAPRVANPANQRRADGLRPPGAPTRRRPSQNVVRLDLRLDLRLDFHLHHRPTCALPGFDLRRGREEDGAAPDGTRIVPRGSPRRRRRRRCRFHGASVSNASKSSMLFSLRAHGTLDVRRLHRRVVLVAVGEHRAVVARGHSRASVGELSAPKRSLQTSRRSPSGPRRSTRSGSSALSQSSNKARVRDPRGRERGRFAPPARFVARVESPRQRPGERPAMSWKRKLASASPCIAMTKLWMKN